eukprot:1813501-Amphidinium_carterae.1
MPSFFALALTMRQKCPVRNLGALGASHQYASLRLHRMGHLVNPVSLRTVKTEATSRWAMQRIANTNNTWLLTTNAHNVSHELLGEEH